MKSETTLTRTHTYTHNHKIIQGKNTKTLNIKDQLRVKQTKVDTLREKKRERSDLYINPDKTEIHLHKSKVKSQWVSHSDALAAYMFSDESNKLETYMYLRTKYIIKS